MSKHSSIDSFRDLRPAAANGLYDRRAFLKGGTAFATAIGGYTLSETLNAQSLVDDPWSASAGTPTGPYEARSRFENSVVRTMTNPNGEPRSQQSRTPHHMLDGTFTPNGLHFVISRSGPPEAPRGSHGHVAHLANAFVNAFVNAL